MSKKASRSFLPSKRFGIAFAILILLIAATITTVRLLQKRQERLMTTSSNTMLDVTVGDIIENDADGDGLEDWEEILWGTHPSKPDTDGDGINDADEIAVIRASMEDSTTTPENEELSRGDAVTRQLFTTYSLLQTQGEVTDERRAELDRALAESMNQPLLAEVLEPSDFSSVAESQTTVNVYAQAMQEAFEDLSLNDTTIINIITTLEGGGDVSQFRPLARELQQVYNALKSMNVPSTTLTDHVNMTNAYGELAKAFDYLTNLDNDPLLTFQAFIQLESIFDYTIETTQLIEGYFRRKGNQY